MFCAEFYGTTRNFFIFLNRAEAFASLRPRNVAECPASPRRWYGIPSGASQPAEQAFSIGKNYPP